MKRSPYFSLFSKALAFIPRRRSADAVHFLASHSYSAASGAPQSILMADYLVSSCGFDPDRAARASKLLGRIESRHQPDSVLGFFKSYGFDNTQVKKVISANPRWLLLDVEKTLAPKFRALQDLGFSCSDITHIVRSNNHVISHKLQNVLSKIQFWQGTLGSNDLLMKLCKRNRWFLGYSIEKRIQPNIEILRDCGITDQKLSMILRQFPLLITRNAETLKALISRVEGLGVARTSGMFIHTLKVLHMISKKNFKAHLEFFKGFGWSEDDFLAAFRKAPTLVGFSLKSLQRKMEFFVNEAGCAPSYLALRPEKKFVEKFVNCYKEYPELIELQANSMWSLRPERPSSMQLPNVLSIKTARDWCSEEMMVKKVICADPRLLLRDVEKTLAPKFRALQDLGFSCSDITHLVRSNNHVISQKSQTIVSKIQLWQGLLGSNDFFVKLCKSNREGTYKKKKKKKKKSMTLMNRSPYVSLLSNALAFVPYCRPADAALFLATHSYSAASGAPQSSLMAEYLVSSCGFDPDQAAKASKLLGRVESRHQPDCVLGLFKSYGFDNTQVKKVISANPRLLLRDVEKTLAPKFRALQDLGFSCSDITHLVRSNHHVISHKSQTILSKIQLWQGLLGSNDFLVNLCKKNKRFLGYSIEKRIQPNIEILRDCGITDQKLSMILRQYPLLITRNAENLKALISRVEGLGVPRTSGMFLLILSVLQSVSEKNFKAHLEFFKGFGWSEDDFLAAFRKNPTFVRFSLKSLQRKMEFLVNEAGCAPSYLALRPEILLFSLEKRLMPRHQIVTGLKSRGVCISNLNISTYVKYPEKKFVEKFINCYKEMTFYRSLPLESVQKNANEGTSGQFPPDAATPPSLGFGEEKEQTKKEE
ncbi:hypothetical protein C4D60_Mb04t01820 [Musa balbisiana]|uniref:Uncharacterized protein n=1 Tax=Musa balbisiana TaxID=52838 RepID=A0A4V4H9G2_MUSBA|nr:hypothetical protein C4D60_Mb04t01820 [Musa balbisiana]